MDIHAPMEPPHTWRDFSLHLGSISTIPVDEYRRLLDNAATAIDLLTLKQFLVGLDQQYVTELKQ